MNKGHLTTEAYKGVRDFYPEDMAVQSYIFDTWAKTAESFGYERYDASILEPSELYKNKGVENEEIVNEQTYTFIDRGDREVTLRPEMTPTVARMVAGKRRELKFPLRWYSIPNLFRYERPQRGRLREHWQLNCDMFGADDYTADVEMIALAYQLFIDFGANPDQFQIRLNNRKEMDELYSALGINSEDTKRAITRLNDRFRKISKEEYITQLSQILDNNQELVNKVYTLISEPGTEASSDVASGLATLGITNVVVDRSLARGFDYYTGTIFELFDVSGENNRSMLGGGRYDNLTGMFSDEAISGVGFGMGDVTMRDFLITHHLLPESVKNTSACLTIIPTDNILNLEAQKIALAFRQRNISTTVDMSSKKIGKKIADAAAKGTRYSIVVGTNEIETGTYTLKDLVLGTEEVNSLEHLLTFLITQQV